MAYHSPVLEVRTATGRDRADVARVLATAFDDDPLARWLVPHPQSLRRLFAAQGYGATSIDATSENDTTTGSEKMKSPVLPFTSGRGRNAPTLVSVA